MPPKVKLPIKKKNEQSQQEKLYNLQNANKVSNNQNNNFDNVENLQNENPESFLNNAHLEQNAESAGNCSAHNFQNENTKKNETKEENLVDSFRLEMLQKELEDWKNRSLRLTADLTNLGRQEEINLSQTRKNTKKAVVNLILPFLNTLYLSFAFVPNITDEKVQKFVQTLQKSFTDVLKDLTNNGIELVIPANGAPFDPVIMTALNPPENEENARVKQVVSLGLRIDNQLIRPVSVML
jgi:molecular chaperone GrpE (heat shock protein)